MEPIDASLVFGDDIPNNVVSQTAANDCPICLTEITEENVYTVPECSHTYHIDCIISWFRHGNEQCPLCRGMPIVDGENDYHTRDYRLKFIKNFAKRTDAPKTLKTIVQRLQKAKEKQKARRTEFAEWKKSEEGLEFKRLHKIHNTLQAKQYSRHTIYNIERELLSYPIIPIKVKI